MNISEEKQKELDAKLRWIADYNMGKAPRPRFTLEEMIEVRRWQLKKSEALIKTLMKKK